VAGENGRNDFYGETGCCPRQIKFPHSEASVGGQGRGLRGKNRAGVYGRHDCMKRYSTVSIPTNRAHSVTFFFSDRYMKLKASKAQADAVMQHLANIAPWVLLGHAPEIAAAYKKDRDKLVAFVAARRAQVMKPAVPRTAVS